MGREEEAASAPGEGRELRTRQEEPEAETGTQVIGKATEGGYLFRTIPSQFSLANAYLRCNFSVT